MMEKSSKNPLRLNKEIRGFLVASLGLLFLLALVSFHPYPETKNWLGFVGFCSSLCFRYTLGLLSYPIPVALMYLGWQIAVHDFKFSLPPKYLLVTTGLATFSSALVLSVLSNSNTGLVLALSHLTYYSSKENVPITLGGFPIFFLYQIVPILNFSILFGPIGNFLIGILGLILSMGILIHYIGIEKVKAVGKKSNRYASACITKSAWALGKAAHVSTTFMFHKISKIPLKLLYSFSKEASLKLFALVKQTCKQQASRGSKHKLVPSIHNTLWQKNVSFFPIQKQNQSKESGKITTLDVVPDPLSAPAKNQIAKEEKLLETTGPDASLPSSPNYTKFPLHLRETSVPCLQNQIAFLNPTSKKQPQSDLQETIIVLEEPELSCDQKIMDPSFPEKMEIDTVPLCDEGAAKTKRHAVMDCPLFGPSESTGSNLETPPGMSTICLETQHLPSPLFHQQAYQVPPFSLLGKTATTQNDPNKEILWKEARRLEGILKNFGIEASVVDIHEGARITSFEVQPATGVKVQRIKILENDIALNMEAKSIRIIAPIPGKAAVGIEVPSLSMQHIDFRKILETYVEQGLQVNVPILLGEMISGEPVIVDLTKMPHLIVAGATGSGKSVCINSIIMSILMTCSPDQVRMIMIDPKKVELSCYSALPHMIAPVATETQGAKEAFNWLIREMEWRYEILRRLGLRHIQNFNERIPQAGESELLGMEVPEKMPFIITIVDELADLMMTTATADIENAITRIAQKARAVGIHLVLATQRPSREVITGLIKANFPARIAFKVSSRINSQIILDMIGAEELLGNGDLLFISPVTPNPIRAQGAFVQEEEIHNVVEFICQRCAPNYLVASFDDNLGPNATKACAEKAEDPLYGQAIKLILESGVISTTFLQRKLKIGYPRAASLLDEMEQRGVVSPQDHCKQRKLIIEHAAIKQWNTQEDDI